ncbi:MAG: hypothetical protein QOH90_1347, partial [Actinomycetota bacterium]|nr:hypothetical protein [Actinomycetota bacterium]
MTSILIKDAASVVRFEGEGPLRGDALQNVVVEENLSVVVSDGLVESVGRPIDRADQV